MTLPLNEMQHVAILVPAVKKVQQMEADGRQSDMKMSRMQSQLTAMQSSHSGVPPGCRTQTTSADYVMHFAARCFQHLPCL